MNTILKNYGKLLSSVDRWFDRCASANPTSIACMAGCSECCRGLFDITLLDAWYLKSGFDLLDESTRRPVLKRVETRLVSLKEVWPEFALPYILNVKPEEDWDQLMPDEDEISCPLLSENGDCLLYEYRPMTCRLHGIPLVDVSGEVFHDEWCTLNFRDGDPVENMELRWNFASCFETEHALFQQFTHGLFKQCINELDTFIPTALLIDFCRYDWKGWLERNMPLLMASRNL